jgi:Uma2 family endonuclease
MAHTASAERRLTEEEYLLLEEKSEIRHEFFNGEMFAMAGGTYNHSIIASNLIAHLGNLLKGRCSIGNADLRIKVEETGLLTYPDVSVICGTPELVHRPADTLLNPALLAEVLSPSTELYDRGTKFEHYRKIPSLGTYLLVGQDSPRIEQYVRETEFTWEYRTAAGIDTMIELPALKITLSLAEIFAGINFHTQPGGHLRPLRT